MTSPALASTSTTPQGLANQTPIEPLYQELPIGKLPNELMISIFGHTCASVGSRITLTHVCSHWREIALSVVHLWTYVEVRLVNEKLDTELRSLISLLEMQLSRTATSPLDVVFFPTRLHQRNQEILEPFRKYATLSRWHSLILRMDYTRSVDNIEDITLFVSDLLPSLKSLIIVYKGRDPIAQTIRGMTTGLRTSRPGLTLSVIDIHPISAHAVIEPPVEIATINRIYGGRLDQISSLVLPNLGGNSVKVDFLPKHVNRVECSWRQDHLFPHVRSYKLSGCTFARGSKHDLGSLVSLTVAIDLSVRMACHFFFPSLRFLSCGGIRLEHRSSLRAPALEQFQLNLPPFHILERIKMAKTTEAALQTSSFVMLPNLSLVIKDCLQTHTIVQFLRRCGHVENVSLTFSDEADVLAFIEDLSREEPFEHIRTEEESSPIRSGPIVSELKLNLLSSQLDRKDLKSKIADLMRTTGSATLPLKIYSRYREDGDYALLA